MCLLCVMPCIYLHGLQTLAENLGKAAPLFCGFQALSAMAFCLIYVYMSNVYIRIYVNSMTCKTMFCHHGHAT